MEIANIGLIGCGNISEQYLRNLSIQRNTNVVAVCDLIERNAMEKAEKYHIPHVCGSVEELLAMPEVDIVLILTQPQSHVTLAEQALKAHKHVYIEKPFALTREDGRFLLELAKEKGVYFSGAPDVALGAQNQTARKLIDDGWIGKIVGASYFSFPPVPPETWHPNPAFLYKEGAGPLYDNGPNAIATLVYLLGPVSKVMCMARKTYESRLITSQPHYGERIDVEVPTFLKSIIEFDGGHIAALTLSCDSRNSKGQEMGLEIYGSEGTLVLDFGNGYDGEIQYKKNGMTEWVSVPLLSCHKEPSRGIGLAEMAAAISADRPQRLSADMVYHIMDVLISLDEAWQNNQQIEVESSFENTPLLPLDLRVDEMR